jgi:CheY-like chemotaxis protein/HPt (histidine-containing phosphotransfer) domain-containing protein
VLTKPFKPSEILALLKAVVGTAAVPAPLPPTPVRKTGPALDVLLVEDNAINARLAQQVLVKAGHRVVAVDSGFAAMSALERGGCDLVLMDIQMPGMDGLEATRLIRRNEQLTGDHLPIIALTAHAMDQHRERCLRAGMDAFLVKPIQAQELLDAIERLGCRPRSAFAPRRKPVVDRAVLLDRIDDDSDLLEEVTDMLRDKGARALAEARSALAARNADQCALLLHTLSGMLRSLAADAALELVDRLEIIVAEGNWEVMENGFVRLEAEIERLAAELNAMVRERRARSKVLVLDAGDVAMPRGASGLA